MSEYIPINHNGIMLISPVRRGGFISMPASVGMPNPLSNPQFRKEYLLGKRSQPREHQIIANEHMLDEEPPEDVQERKEEAIEEAEQSLQK